MIVVGSTCHGTAFQACRFFTSAIWRQRRFVFKRQVNRTQPGRTPKCGYGPLHSFVVLSNMQI